MTTDAAEITSESAAALSGRGRELRLAGHLEEALQCFETAVRMDPESARAQAGYGATLAKLGRSAEAIERYWESLRFDPGNARVYQALGNVYMTVGRADAAVDCYRQALALHPGDEFTGSNLLFALHFDIRCTAGKLYQEHCEFGRRHGMAAPAPHTNSRCLLRPLKVGYVSGDFRDHPVCYFFEPVLAHHGRDRVDITLYSTTAQPDAFTDRMRRMAARWRDVRDTCDDDVARIVRDDEIDILVDLAGHTAGTLLGVFARKPAPVQVTYLGYPNTTGIPGIDYRLSDALADPPSITGRLHTGEIIRLPRCFLCYAPPNGPPEVGEAPFTRNGRITFGSCSKPLKWNREVFRTWAAILRRVPESRLLLHHSTGGRMGRTARVQVELRTRVSEEFLAYGVSPDRIGMLGSVDWPAHWNWYHDVDLALDPFPYNGTTLTCETLWMGVPVVALEGQSHVSRVGLSILKTLGLDRLVAGSIEQYVETCVQLAGQPAELAWLRSGMRDRMRRSPLMDAAGLTQALEEAYREMWRRWVES